jgi:hypothetical protein
LDLDAQKIHFYLNGKDLGMAFQNIPVGPNKCYFPAISMEEGEKVVFNFGRLPL